MNDRVRPTSGLSSSRTVRAYRVLVERLSRAAKTARISTLIRASVGDEVPPWIRNARIYRWLWTDSISGPVVVDFRSTIVAGAILKTIESIRARLSDPQRLVRARIVHQGRFPTRSETPIPLLGIVLLLVVTAWVALFQPVSTLPEWAGLAILSVAGTLATTLGRSEPAYESSTVRSLLGSLRNPPTRKDCSRE